MPNTVLPIRPGLILHGIMFQINLMNIYFLGPEGKRRQNQPPGAPGPNEKNCEIGERVQKGRQDTAGKWGKVKARC